MPVFLRFCTRSRQYSKTTVKENDCCSKGTLSKLYPDYRIIYSSSNIKLATIFNVTKRNATILNSALIPIITSFHILDCIPLIDALGVIFLNSLVTFVIHISSWMCNNHIGIVYFKDDDQTVILSYVNYWGKRINLKINLTDIQPLSETPMNFCHWLYRRLEIKSYRSKLKLVTELKSIKEKPCFIDIFGIDESSLK
ncbi:uncharacterized protein LOC122397291 isoform X2 [Colletes gigas]|uniref:uncharacterized protein LOC122397291 isoform X2 n=1 Tax=Colletes gigas TaxID=935657 RepID=UPI001C9A90A9|nr:uncharacterized protein LOC122397291 isoform X2 [Colletes gigas]